MARYALSLPAELKREAEELAREQGVSLNQFILWSVAQKVGALKQEIDDPAFPGIVYRSGAAGIPTPTVRGAGIRVQTLVQARNAWHMSTSEIADQYELPEPRVKEALAFYQAHQAVLDAAIAAETALERAHAQTTAPPRR
jgi:uncharacterized protein (DUF433 family)